MPHINIYTDGSCFPKEKKGTWAAILLIQEKKTIIKGEQTQTNHNRMELTAAIKAIEHVVLNKIPFSELSIFSDSQYVIGIPERKTKLKANNFFTKKGNKINNADLIEQLILLIEKYVINFIKVKAHQKKGADINYNSEVDKLVRKNLRNLSPN